MTKISLFICCLLFIGCESEETQKVNDSGIGNEKIFVKEIIYKNHSYLKFKDTECYGQGWVHNPDCNCYKTVYD